MIPVSVPLSTCIIDVICFVWYRCSKYHRPILLGWELLSQILNHKISLLTVSIDLYITKGNVLFWYPINLSWPSIECPKFVPLVVKCPFLFLLHTVGSRSARPSGSTSNITACTKFRGTLRWYSCLLVLKSFQFVLFLNSLFFYKKQRTQEFYNGSSGLPYWCLQLVSLLRATSVTGQFVTWQSSSQS